MCSSTAAREECFGFVVVTQRRRRLDVPAVPGMVHDGSPSTTALQGVVVLGTGGCCFLP